MVPTGRPIKLAPPEPATCGAQIPGHTVFRSRRRRPCARLLSPRTLTAWQTKIARQGDQQKPARNKAAGRRRGSAMKSSIKTFGLAIRPGAGVAAPAGAADIKIMTGPQGGSWVPLGGQLKDMWEKADSRSASAGHCRAPASPMCAASTKARPTSASAIRSRPSTACTARRRSRSRRPMSATSPRSIRNTIQFVVIADSGINTIADLKGKAITTQQRGNTGEQITRQLLGGERADLQGS